MVATTSHTLSHARPVEAVTKEFSANLKQQGWKDSAGSLMGKTNAILRREQGADRVARIERHAEIVRVVERASAAHLERSVAAFALHRQAAAGGAFVPRRIGRQNQRGDLPGQAHAGDS